MNKNNKFYRKCFVCQKEEHDVVGTLRYELYDGSPLSKKVDVAACRHCGAVFYCSDMSAEHYARYYAENLNYVRASAVGGVGGLQGPERARFEATERILASYRRPETATMVDVGCAQGGCLKILKERGWKRLIGVDPLFANVAALSRSDIRAVAGELGHLPLSSRSCSGMILGHVLEHVFDVAGAMAEIRRVLRDDGILYVETPDAAQYPADLRTPLADFIHEHINHFDQYSLANCLGRFGFACLETGNKELKNGCGGDLCLYGVFRKTDDHIKIHPDFSLSEKCGRLFADSASVLEKLKECCIEERKVYIWGLSSYMLYILGMIYKMGVDVAGIFDGDMHKQKKRIHDMPILDPSNIAKIQNPNAVLIIQSGIYEQSMRVFIDESAFSGKIVSI